MDAQYRPTYDDSNTPAHYGFKQPARFAEIEKACRAAEGGSPEPAPPRPAADPEAEVRRIIRELDDQGRWVSTYAGERLVGQPRFAPGFKYLSSAVFSRNLETLSEYLGRK
jgi:hypothetical protein